MKKLIALVLLSSALAFSSCNKNKKFNKDLDGTWAMTVEDGKPVDSGDQSTFTFSKDKKDNGTVIVTFYDNGKATDAFSGSYKISEKGTKLVIDVTYNGATYHTDGKISSQDDKKFTYSNKRTQSGMFGGVVLSVSEDHVSMFEKR